MDRYVLKSRDVIYRQRGRRFTQSTCRLESLLFRFITSIFTIGYIYYALLLHE